MRLIAKINRLLLPCLLAYADATLAQSNHGGLQGYVTNAATDSVLANIGVFVSAQRREVFTDSAGCYKLLLPPGEHKVELRAEGFRNPAKKIVVAANVITRLDFSLKPLVFAIGDVEVIAERLKFPEAGRILLCAQELRNPPPLAEPDVFRAIHALPGISAVSDWGSEFYVRGGHFDQTLVLWDGVPIYNANHLGGLFSAFNTDAIRNVTLYKGGQPLHYDSRLSGILDIKPSFGNTERRQWQGFFGVSSVSLSAQGPFGPGSFALSARRTYLDLLSLTLGGDLPYSFGDAGANYKAVLGERDILYFSGFYSTDNLSVLEESDFHDDDVKQQPNWGNRLFNFRWQHLLSSQRSLELALFRSRSVVAGESRDVKADNRIDEIGINSKLYAQFPSHTVLLALDLRRRSFNYRWHLHSNDLSDTVHPPAEMFFDYAPPDFDFRKNAEAAALSLEDDLAFSSRLTLTLGLKGNWNSRAQDLNLTPRLGLTYRAHEGLLLRALAARYYQYLYTLKERRTENLLAPFTAYFPVDEESALPPSRVEQFLAGLEATSLPLNLNLSLEAYYKRYHDLITSVNDLPRFRLEPGRALGVDLQLAKEAGRVSGWLGYSFGISQKRNGNFVYYTSFDRRHSVKLLGNLALSRKWKLSIFWTYSSGAPYTPVIGRFNSGKDLREERSGTEIPIDLPGSPIGARPLEGAKNSRRFPAHHRLDLSFQGEFHWGRTKLFPSLQILNVYNNTNAFYYIWELDDREPKQETTHGIPLLPTVGVRFEF